MNATPLEKVLSAIGDYKQSGKSYKARCPAHEENSPSLSISAAGDGTVLVKCHSGCTAEAIVMALGLTMRDLFPSADDDTTSRNSKKPLVPSTGDGKMFSTAAAAVADLEKRLGKRSATWTYKNAEDQPVGVIVRWDKASGKDIRPVAKIGPGWVQGGMPTPRPLYRLPELLKSSGPVYVTEGEKAADALHALGFTVTTSAHGANSAGGTDWTPLAGRDVVIIPDNDEAGAGYAEAVIDLLSGLTPRPCIKFVNLPGLPAGGDAVEFIAERKGASHE
jgi:putative DNA primase/helicase